MGKSREFCLIHCHLFKNGGTTLDWAFKRYFGDAFLDHRDNEQMLRGAAYLGPFLKENIHLHVISSHIVRLPLPELQGVRLKPLFMIRHPLDRVESVYEFERGQKADTPGAKKAKDLGLAAYILWRMQPDVGITLRDFQCRFCTGKITRNDLRITDKDGDMGVQVLKDTPFTGLVNRFDESLVVFEYHLTRYYPDIDLAYIPRNVNRSITADPEQRGRALLDSLPPAAKESLLENNRQDLKLYQEANLLLDQRIGEIPDFGARLTDFRRRCRNLIEKTRTW